MKSYGLLLTILLSSGLGACAAAPGGRGHAIDVDVRPPPARIVVVPALRRGYVWAPGYWFWNGRRHVWVDGHWLRERRGWHWEPAHWEERRGRWHFEPGHWER